MRAHKYFTVVLVVFLLATPLGAMVAHADTPTPIPDYHLPNGWGPVGGIQVIGADNGNITYQYDTDFPCDESLRLERYDYPNSPAPTLLLRINQTVPSGVLRIKGAINPWSDYLAPFMDLIISTYMNDGTTLVSSSLVTVQGGLPVLIEGFWITDSWYLLDLNIPTTTEYGGYLKLELARPYGQNLAGYNFSGMYIADHNYSFPSQICSYVLPTRTPTPNPTGTPIPTPTGTITQTWTPSPSPTLAPTATLAATGTPTPTPVPYSTWTPSPSPTVWQSPMATLAAWQYTPDATVTPYPTPTTYPALPTWESWPTISFPTRETRTPYPTLVSEDLTTTPMASATPYTLTVDTDQMFDNIDSLDTSINFMQVYTVASQLTGGISGPVRALRGTVRNYTPTLAPVIDTILLAGFVVIVIYAWQALMALIRFVIRIVEVIMEFVPL